ncbi:MAG: DNA polymerase III subunit gamma/tau [Methylococcales bacterium]|nr:DNA polymerase III subunit gamma/tau [Methylococcales bacterium]
MTYQVLARKWRPRKFSELVGQVHVVKALTHAIAQDRLHHAYLFTGTRGVGKTTLARIFAKTINCLALEGHEPCGQCSVCNAVDQGKFPDLIEVDAASRTKVEQTRELLENTQYTPAMGRFKVYLIDEVHMLSGASFNAFLKTLEEPPAHVKFLLATTDPQKLPVTVLSRCLQLNLKRLPVAQIAGYLTHITGLEQIDAEPEALQLLAQAADGSMRDSLSLLDQAIVHGGGSVRLTDVEAMLGLVARYPVLALVAALAKHDVSAVMQTLAEIADSAPDFAMLLKQCLQLLHRVALYQQAPDALDTLFPESKVAELATRMPQETVQLFYQIGLMGLKDLALTPNPRDGLEMVLLRMLAFRPDSPATATPRQTTQPEAAPAPYSTPANEPAPQATPNTPLETPKPANDTDWHQLIASLRLSAMTGQLAKNCTLVSLDEHRCELALAPELNTLHTTTTADNLQAALQQHFARPLKLVIRITASTNTAPPTPAQVEQQARDQRQQQAEHSIAQDTTVQALSQTFAATVAPHSIKPEHD